jgi:hypothetical protein
MGFHPPKISAAMAGLGEAGGGALLALGLATPVAGAASASTMLAAGAVHKPAGFFATEGGCEYSAILGLAGAALPSLDRAGIPLTAYSATGSTAMDGRRGADGAGIVHQPQSSPAVE